MTLVMRIVAGDLPDLTRIDISRLMYWIVPGQILTVGRDAARADVAIGRDARMSPLHFHVCGQADEYRILDLDSQHGTFVNGQRIREGTLHDGDIILAGETTFQISRLDGSGESVRQVEAGRDPPAAPVDQPAGLQVVLKIESGPFDEVERTTVTHRLNWIGAGQSLSIGRTDRAELVVRHDAQMSSLHFEVACDEQSVRIRDLASRNGTYVNGRRIEAAELLHGDLILAGGTHFRVALQGGAVPAEPGVSSATPPTEIATPDDASQQAEGERRSGSRGSVAGTPSPSAMQVVLTVVRGPSGEVADGYTSRLVTWLGAGQAIRVGRRAATADLAIQRDPKMSSLHFELSCDGRHCRLEDLQSSNGTFVNGCRVLQAVLQDHDEIRAGDTIFGVAICGGERVSGTFLEFAAVAHRQEKPSAEVVGGPDPVPPDVDAIFAMIKARLQARV